MFFFPNSLSEESGGHFIFMHKLLDMNDHLIFGYIKYSCTNIIISSMSKHEHLIHKT